MAKKINFILPFPTKRPNGGPKIMFQYANLLAERGYDVQIYHSLNTSYMKYVKPYVIRAVLHKMRKTHRPSWFELKSEIVSCNVKRISDKYIRNADYIISTWWATALEVDNLNDLKGKKINLIQDYEKWTGHEDLLLKSYALPNTTNVVIASYLYDIVSPLSVKKTYRIFNAIDQNEFNISVPIKERKPSILMMYSDEKRKGTSYGLDALLKIKEKYPSIVISLFGVKNRPNNLNEQFNYYKQPKNIPELYNSHAIFLTPSIHEGFALPACEALNCGCALIATDIEGHKNFLNENSGLSIKTHDVHDIVLKIEKLLDDDSLRIKLAKYGNEFIRKNFSWDKNIESLEEIFND